MSQEQGYRGIDCPPEQWSLDWKKLPIQDTGEPLVPITKASELAMHSAYYHQKIRGALSDIYVRQTVLDKLLQAQRYLKETHPGYTLLVWDGWRPVAVQQALFNDYKADLVSDASAWTGPEEKRLFDLGINGRTDEEQAEFERLATIKIQHFVSMPSEDPQCPSPHLTGGSVDLTVVDANGQLLNMGTEFDDFSDRAHTHFFEIHDGNLRIRDNRRLLFSAMTHAGFTNFPYEWWHFDFGNQFYAFRSQLADPSYAITARYGPVLSPSSNG